jgi:hypothetical protein
MNYWDFRVIAYKGDPTMYRIHRVTYDKEGNPVQLDSSDRTIPEGKTPEELSHYLIHQLSALTKPVLDADLFVRDSTESATQALDLLKRGKHV